MPQFNSDRCTLAALVSLALGCASLGAGAQQNDGLMRDGLAAPDPQLTDSLSRYENARAAHLVDWLSDGSLLIETRFADSSQIHRVRAALGMREQVSFAQEGISVASARPYASDEFVYLESDAHSGTSQLFLQRLDTHQHIALTDGRALEGVPVWAHDGKRLAFTSNRRNGVDSDIYLLDSSATEAAPRLVIAGAGFRWRIFDWSSDDQKLLLGRESTGAAASESDSREVELFIADVGAGQLSPVTAAANPVPTRRSRRERAAEPSPLQVRSARFAADGHNLLLLSSSAEPAAQYQHLYSLDPATHQLDDLTAQTHHDVEQFDRSVDGHYLAYVINDAGISRLTIVDQQRKLELAVTELPAGLIHNLKFDAAGKQLALTEESVRSPADVFVFDPDTHALTRWTQSEVGALDAQELVEPQSVHFPTWDRIDGAARQLLAQVYRPLTSATGASGAPVLIMLCGGGGTQCRAGFDPWLQFLVNELGIVVVAPDLRGSSGYGRAFQALGEGSLSDDAVRDVGSLLVWIGLQRELDRNRVAIQGEGYGGYLALESLAEYGDRLRGGIAAFGTRLSPLGNIPAIRKPLLVVQGLNNPAAPANEIEQLRARLRIDGVAVHSLESANEGQYFTRRSDRDAYWSAAANFLLPLLR